jgi:hypothetical protein
MTANRIGGDDSDVRYLLLYLLGVVLGSGIRLVAFLFPTSVVRTLEDALLPSP